MTNNKAIFSRLEDDKWWWTLKAGAGCGELEYLVKVKIGFFEEVKLWSRPERGNKLAKSISGQSSGRGYN